MLLKAAIIQRGGSIREQGSTQTIGFDRCVRKCFSEGNLKFLDEEQVLLIQALNGLRDAAYHHILQVSEQMLYLKVQAGITLFDDILTKVFGAGLSKHLPKRALSVSTTPPTDLSILFYNEVEEIRKLCKPGMRRGTEVRARLRALKIVDSAFDGVNSQPDEPSLTKLAKSIASGATWEKVFTGVALITTDSTTDGFPISIRLSKNSGAEVKLVPEGTPGAMVVAVKRVNELGYYTLGCRELASKLNLSMNKTVALVKMTNAQANDDYYKEIVIGKSRHKRYSIKAVEFLRNVLKERSIEEIWSEYQGH